jgi:PAS domain S-box-containing protein
LTESTHRSTRKTLGGAGSTTLPAYLQDGRLFASCPLGIIVFDARGLVSAANAAAEGILGVAVARMLGVPWSDARWRTVHDDGSPFLEAGENVVEALRAGQSLCDLVLGVFNPRLRDRIWLNVNVTPIQDGGGTTCGAYVMLQDISIQRRVQQRTRESEDRFRSLFAAMSEGMALHQVVFNASGRPADYRILDVNPAFEQQTGIKRGAVIGKLGTEAYGTPEAPYLDVYARVAKTRQPTSFESDFAPLGKRFRITVISPHPAHFATVFEDITERVRVQEALAESQALLDSIVESTQDMVCSVEPTSYRLLSFNRSLADYFLRVHGVRIEIGMSTPDLFSSDELAKKWIGFFEKTLAEGSVTTEYRASESADVLHLTCSALKRGSKAFGISVFGRDITERKRAEAEIQSHLDQIERMLASTIDSFSTLVELRDPYTAGHERRVGILAAAIAAEMGLDANVQRGLRLAGAVHDVGKIAVPAEILAKPTRLTEIEFAMIKVHAQLGYDVLREIDSPWPIAEVARQHHERIDGSGYPRGLAGDEILLEARIIAVADVVEAISSHRPYRPGLGIDAALDEIEKNSGRLYDPLVAGACLRVFRERSYVLAD